MQARRKRVVGSLLGWPLAFDYDGACPIPEAGKGVMCLRQRQGRGGRNEARERIKEYDIVEKSCIKAEDT